MLNKYVLRGCESGAIYRKMELRFTPSAALQKMWLKQNGDPKERVAIIKLVEYKGKVFENRVGLI